MSDRARSEKPHDLSAIGEERRVQGAWREFKSAPPVPGEWLRQGAVKTALKKMPLSPYLIQLIRFISCPIDRFSWPTS